MKQFFTRLFQTISPKRIIIFILLFCAVMSAYFINSYVYSTPKTLTRYAQQIIQTCKAASYKPTCYEDEVPKLLGKISMEDAFTITEMIQREDPSYAYCHNLGHKLSFQEARKNQSDWKSILTRCPLSLCNYGCLHGSLIEKYRGEVLTDDQIIDAQRELSTVCEKRPNWNPTIMDQSMCYHALGHLAMYISAADIKKSEGICKSVAIKSDGRDYFESCIGGVFMTLLYGADPEDIALTKHIKPKKEEVTAFCSAFDGITFQVCRRESATYYEADFLRDPNALVEFCSFAHTHTDISQCYATVLNRLTDIYIGRSDWLDVMSSYCDRLTINADLCYEGFAMRMIQTDATNIKKAVSLCQRSENTDIRILQTCLDNMRTYADTIFERGSNGYNHYCAALPGAWKDDCIKQNESATSFSIEDTLNMQRVYMN